MNALVAWLWQGTALAFVALVAIRACRWLDAATRHALWWGVLAAVLALPWLPSLAVFARAPQALGAPASASTVGDAAALVLPSPPDWAIAIALGAWLGTVVLGGLRIARGLAFVRRLRREGVPLDPEQEARLPLWNSTPTTRPIALLVSPLVRTACAAGLGRAVIVLPPSLVDAVDDETLDQIAMHERAHLDRYDDAWRLAETVVDAVAGLHPAIRIALAQIELEREAACDDRVVLRTGAADRYAASLADAASCAAVPHGRTPQLIAMAVGRRSALVTRVARLLDRTRRRRAHLTPAATLAGLVLLGVGAGAASRLEPVVAFESRVIDALAPTVSVSTAFRPPDAGEDRAPVSARRSRPRRTEPLVSSTQASPASAAPGALPASAESSTQGAEPEATSSPLASRPLAVPTDVPLAAVQGTIDRAGAANPPSPWAVAADGGAAIGGAARRGGVAVGTGARKSSTAIAGFFTRTGRAIGRSF